MAKQQSITELATTSGMNAETFAVLVAALERERAEAAALAFHDAFLKMSTELPEINERGQILYRSGKEGTYAKHEDIQDVIKPILNKHGFYQRFETTYPNASMTRTTAVLTHKKGHSITSSFESMPDTTGAKTSPQGRGSAMAYGRRYTTVDILNITTRGEDKDGAAPEAEPERGPEPEGFHDWAVKLADVALHQGLEALEVEWAAARPEHRAYFTAPEWMALKDLAKGKAMPL